MRLTDGGGGQEGEPASGLGILEIFHAGAWGTVCEGQRGSRPDDYGPPLTDVRATLDCHTGLLHGTSMHMASALERILVFPIATTDSPAHGYTLRAVTGVSVICLTLEYY